jgi:hypothetical protein
MAEGGRERTGTLAVFGVAVLLNLVLTVFVLDQLGRTRQQVDDLRGELASKQDVAMLRPVRVDEILSQRCERCHTDRRFAALAGMSEPEVLETIQRMRSHPGADIPADEVRQIEAALLLLRCTTCHDEGVLSRLVLMPPDERVRFLRTKVSMPSSGFRPDQVGQLIRAFEVLVRRPPS